MATSVAGVQVTLGGISAPLLSVSAAEIDCVVRFELGGQSTTSIQVQYNGVQSNLVLMPVTPLAEEILEVLNEDFTVNSASNPASPGSILSAYVAGAGQSLTPGLDGQVNQPPFALAANQFQVQAFSPPSTGLGAPSVGTTLPVTWAGAAPGLIAGILQINFVAPTQTSNLQIMVGTSSSQIGVAIQ